MSKEITCEPCLFPGETVLEFSTLIQRPSIKSNESLESNLKTGHREIVCEPILNFHSEGIKAKECLLIIQIKEVIIDSIYSSNEQSKYKFSQWLSKRLSRDYVYLANLFSRNEGVTIEKFRIIQKIERVKEFLSSRKITITRIALNMHYSSVGHLSNQFKKTTGISPSDFRKQNVESYADHS